MHCNILHGPYRLDTQFRKTGQFCTDTRVLWWLCRAESHHTATIVFVASGVGHTRTILTAGVSNSVTANYSAHVDVTESATIVACHFLRRRCRLDVTNFHVPWTRRLSTRAACCMK